MQKLAPLLVCVLAAWLSVAHAEPDYIIQSNAAPLNPLSPAPGAQEVPAPAVPVPLPAAAPIEPVAPVAPVTPAPDLAPTATPAPVSVPAPVPAIVQAPAATASASPRVRIGLLLPTDSKTLGDAAQVVRAGFDAAASTDGNAEVVYFNEQEDNEVGSYRVAVASGVKVVVGPLTRQGIAAVAPFVTVPTLALNALEPAGAPSPKLLSLSLIVEGEARQMARLMNDDGREHPLVFSAGDVLSRRLTQAFVDEWKKETGSAPRVLDWPASTPISAEVASADSVFIAMPTLDAATLKAALPPDMNVYATSQLNTRKPDAALAGIRFIDMPWFLMTEQNEVKHYPRPATPLTVQTERLYALGIDAYRLAVMMAAPKWSAATLRLHGVTGDLKLGRDRQFERILPLAVMMPDAAQ